MRHGREFPKESDGVYGTVCHGRCLCVVSGRNTMAGRLCVSGLRRPQGMDDKQEDSLLLLVPTSDVADGGNHLSPEPSAVEELVLGNVVDVHPKDGLECKGIGTGTGFGVLQDGLADVAEVAAGYGTDRP